MDLSNYATKFDLKEATGINTSKFSKENLLASLKPDVYKLHIDELKTNLSNPSDVHNDLVENTV